MKLSRAIREGAKLGPQVFGKYTDHLGGYCALGGAAMVAMRSGLSPEMDTKQAFPLMHSACPCGEQVHDYPVTNEHKVFAHITHLNDNLHWSRERIADYVEALEVADEATEKALREQPELVNA